MESGSQQIAEQVQEQSEPQLQALGAEQASQKGEHHTPYLYRRRSVIWTDDADNGLPGAPQVEDFDLPMPRKTISPELLPSFPWFASVSITTLILLLVTFYDWSTPADTFAAGSQIVFSNREYHKLFLSMFSHGDAAHLFSNLLGFVGFGYLLKRHFGFLAFPVVPLVLGILTTLVAISLMPAGHSVIGSSGIVFAEVGLYVTLYFFFEQRYSIVVRLIRVTGFMLVLFFPHEYSETTSYLSHGVGFAFGVIAAFVLRPYLSAKLAQHRHNKAQTLKVKAQFSGYRNFRRVSIS